MYSDYPEESDDSIESTFASTSPIAKLTDLLPESEHKMDIINYYNKHIDYIHGISASLGMLNYFQYHKDKAYNVVKTTRAGFTTNCILSALFTNKKILLVAPTNKILYETVHDAYKLYMDISNNYDKLIRPIPNNIDGCSCVVSSLKENPQLKIMPYVSSDDCSTCPDSYKTFPPGFHEFPYKSNLSTCIVKTMLMEKERYVSHYPDVLTITYDKFASLSSNSKDSLFKELISHVDIIVFDEIGEYLSKAYNGFEFKKDESTIPVKSPSINLSYLISRIPIIKNISSRAVMFNLLKRYIMPFMKDTLEPASTGSYPRLILNSLNLESINEKKAFGPVYKSVIMSKQRMLAEKYREYYQTLESMAIDGEPEELITLIISFLNIMSKKQLLLYEQNSVRYHPLYTETHSLYIANAHDELIQNLNMWSTPDKTIIFSDATMPAHNLTRYTARKVKNIFYGDPASNNKSLLMFHDPTIEHFSKYLYFNNIQYREAFFSRLLEFIKLNYYGNEVIWVPSKDIAADISATLNYLGIPTCTHITPDSSAVMITYYGSTFTRGVKSNRRYQILISKANKPKNSYKHVAYMRRNDWSFLSEQDLSYLASQESIDYEDYLYQIEDFNKDLTIPLKHIDFYKDLTIYKENIPESLTKYFNLLSDSIQKEKVFMDTWQAASRAKNPTGIEKSVNICIGWSVSDVSDVLKWGSNTSISYSPVSQKRLLKTQINAIPIPPIISNPDISFIRHWFSGCSIPTSQIGFNESLISGIRELIIEKESITLEELWYSLQHNNIEFSHTTDNYTNGYLIGAVNALLLYNIGDDIEIEKHSPTSYTFTYNPKTVRKKTKKFSINLSEYLNILDILRSIYLINKPIIRYSDIRHFISEKKITTPHLHELYDIIISNNIFESSTWQVEENTITKTTSSKIEQDIIEKLSEIRLKEYPNTFALTEQLIDWFYNQPDIHELDIFGISEAKSSIFHDINFLKETILAFLHSSEYEELHSYGLELEMEQTPDNNIIFTRNTIVY